ncbi:hypothetical protein [Tropicimonas isoalkanivorans]|uniref:Hemolysin-type calcium-binding repeat-containing protein n=1 Tax=Tropicimonas isoalkanivorans TaxID=441112 RepID=A0A1I1NWS3_9RHOB|nr:hypothetical protein [Tropicimonas isoalkanivorans]SFD01782.1 hypothetical protein SAMN04488094_11346 [Tropicimonas isoalkanivorans]
MALVRFTKAHDRHFGYTEFENYDMARFDVKAGVMVLRHEDGKSAGSNFPLRIKITFSDDLKTTKIGGDQVITSGEIESIKWYGKDGDLEVAMTNVGIDAATFQRFFTDFSARTFDNLVAGGSTFNAAGTSDIRTGSGDDVVNCATGYSYNEIFDNGGSDTYNGGLGTDVLLYTNWSYFRQVAPTGILADLGAGTVIGPDGGTDTVVSIDKIFATNYNDVLRGSANADEFGGLGGNDIINGRKGIDTVNYQRDTQNGGDYGINANLKKGVVRDGFGSTDTVRNIENVIGTSKRDLFIGDNADNTFTGNAARDKFVFIGANFGSDTITDFDQSRNEKIVMRAADGFGDLTIDYRANGALIELNDDSSVFLKGFDGTLDSGDFIF